MSSTSRIVRLNINLQIARREGDKDKIKEYRGKLMNEAAKDKIHYDSYILPESCIKK